MISQLLCVLSLMIMVHSNVPIQDRNLKASQIRYVTRFWDNTNGLPVNTVFKTIQDERGYLWAVTEEGLVRFDGQNFNIYNHENLEDIRSPIFYDIVATGTGGYWAANINRLIHINGDQFEILPEYDILKETWITVMLQDGENGLWIGTRNGLLVNARNGRLETVNNWNPEESGAINSILKTSEGIFIGAQNGFFKFSTKTREVKSFPNLIGVEVNSLAENNEGSIWIGSKSHGVFFHENDRVQKVNLPNGLGLNQVTAMQSGLDGELWVGTSKGKLYKFKDEDVNIILDSGVDREIRHIQVSGDGMLWLSTTGKGIIQLIPAEIKMTKLEDGLSSNIILAVYEDLLGVVWAGTAGNGINRIQNGNITPIRRNEGLSHELVLSIGGKDQYLYFGTGEGLDRYDIRNKKIDRSFSRKDGLRGNKIYGIFKDSQERVWVSSNEGGIHRIENHQEIKPIVIPDNFKTAEFVSIYEDSKQNLWFGTYSHGFLKISDNGDISTYSIKDIAPSGMVMDFYEDRDGDIWVGTHDGLILVREGDISIFNKSNGLPFSGAFRIIEDDHGFVWISSNLGIQKIEINHLLNLKGDKNNGKPIPVRLYDSSDGMANNEANGGFYPAGWKLKSGEIWFPTMEGIAKINPDQLSETKKHLSIHIKSLMFGETVFFQGDKISIPPGIQDFRIHYSSIDFNHPKAIKYFYRLVGFQNNWQPADNRNVAYFTSLVPGKYTFEVKANQFGLESETVYLDFIIEPFFYQTLWFKAFVLLGLFLAGILTRKLYTQRLMGKALVFQVDQQTKELQKRNNSLEAAFKEIEQQNLLLKEMTWVQSHDLRGPVAVILGMSDILKNYDQFPKIQKSKVEIVAEIDKAASELDKLIRELNTKSD